MINFNKCTHVKGNQTVLSDYLVVDLSNNGANNVALLCVRGVRKIFSTSPRKIFSERAAGEFWKDLSRPSLASSWVGNIFRPTKTHTEISLLFIIFLQICPKYCVIKWQNHYCTEQKWQSNNDFAIWFNELFERELLYVQFLI